jgi:pantothenate synthetase
MEQQISKDARWQYLEVREARTLSETIHAKNKVVFLGLLKLGTVRLLDNLETTLQ